MFGIHPRGFAGHMARGPEVTRYYLQCPPGDDPENWPDDRVWAELHQRFDAMGAPPLNEGRLIKKHVLDMHNYVMEPMQFGRLFLAGDAAHLAAPIAAKGMNLALHDAFLLGDGLVTYLTKGDPGDLNGYSEACLRRVWQYQEFSLWLSGHAATGRPRAIHSAAGTTLARCAASSSSPAAAAAFADVYIGRDADRSNPLGRLPLASVTPSPATTTAPEVPRTPCPAPGVCRAAARCRPAPRAGRRRPSRPTGARSRGVRSG